MSIIGMISKALIELCKGPDAMTHPNGIEIHITRQKIGQIADCSRETAGRVLKGLENEGLIVAKGETIIVFATR